MSKSLSNFIFIMLFLASSSLYGMDPETAVQRSTVKIETGDSIEFDIDLEIANQSKILKERIETRGEVEEAIPLPEISELQFNLLLPILQKLAELPMAELKESKEEKLVQQLQIITDLKSNDQPLDNQQLIELITGANYLNIPLVEPALKALARRILNKDDWLQLESLGDKLKDLWKVHPAKKLMQEGLSLEHSRVKGVIKSLDGNHISWSREEGTIKIWDKNNLDTEPITLEHPWVYGVIESKDGKKLISWGGCTIKIWDKNNLAAEPLKLKYQDFGEGANRFDGVIESSDGNGKNLISWSQAEGTIKQWYENNLAAEPITLQHPDFSGVIVGLDGKNLISWSFLKSTIKIWNKNNLAAEPITLERPGVVGVIESLDGKKLISWGGSTIKIWDKTNLKAKPITLVHPYVRDVIESMDGKNLISWSYGKGTIKIWNKSDPTRELITLEHPGVDDVIESKDGNLISWSLEEGTIKIWDKNNLKAKPITLVHPYVRDVIESMDGKNLISWSGKGTIKIWNKSDPTREPITLEHPFVSGVIESLYGEKLISWGGDTIKIWDMALLNPAPEQVLLLLTVYFVSEGNQEFKLATEELAELKATFEKLSSITQAFLEQRAPKFIAAIKSAQK